MGTKDQYYTPVEFAKLFNIDKQTLIYYDNQGIFAPAFKNENGYRYYSTDQIPLFSVLLSLRKLNIQGCLLSEYNQSPSNDKLIEMLADKILEYKETVKSLSDKINCLQSKISYIQQSQAYPVNKIMLVPQNHIYCQRSGIIPKSTPHKNALLSCAPLISQFTNSLLTDDIHFAFMPIIQTTEDLQKSQDYRIVLLTGDENLFTNPLVFQPALYLTLYIEDDFYENACHYVDMLKDFMDKVQLTPEPLAFITPLRTFHCTGCGGHKKNKLTKIEIKVLYE